MTLVARPLSPGLGVEIEGLDLSAPITASTAQWLREQYRQHHLLLLRGQPVTPEQQAAFARVFGSIQLRERSTVRGERDDTQHVSNVRKDGLFGTSELDFHVDQLFEDVPLSALILYAIEVPEQGGETHFSNGTRAVEAMPPALLTRMQGLQCRHAYTYAGTLADEWNMQRAASDSPAAVHPMLWTDPETGCRNLWVNKAATVGIVGMDDAAARSLMQEARSYLHGEDRVYRHRWKPNDMLLWNNRLLHHARTPFDPAARRTLRRTPILQP